MRAVKIKDFTSYYVTDCGDIYSVGPNGRITKRVLYQNKKNRYVYVSLSKNGYVSVKSVHRLVAEAFMPNPEKKRDVNHKNGDKTDNNVENLEWATRPENMKHLYKTLLQKPTWVGKYGKDNPKSKVVQQIKNGVVVGIFYGTKEASRKTGISQPSIVKCCNHINHRKSAGGYQWKYQEVNI